MRFRLTARKVGLTLASLAVILVASGILFLPRQAKPADAASTFLPSFTEVAAGQHFTWKEASPWYTSPDRYRVDTGKWVVKEGNSAIGTIEVGINAFYADNKGDIGWAIDTTTSIHGVSLQHEIVESSYPNEGRIQNESPWGFADSYYGPNNPVTYFESPTSGPLHYQEDEATGSKALPVFNNMQHQIAIQRDAYYKMENVYKAGGQGDIKGGVGLGTADLMHIAKPNFALPVALYILAGAGLLLGVGGGIVNQVCSANHCGAHSKTWAMIGGIAQVIGTLLTIVGGVSVTGEIIAGRAAAAAMTEGARSVAAAERMVELGQGFAASSTARGIPGDIGAAFESLDFIAV